jgi:hypothetical protein
MVVVQLLYNDYPSMVQTATTPRELKGIFNFANLEGYTITITQGWDLDWVQTAFQNHQEQLEAAE